MKGGCDTGGNLDSFCEYSIIVIVILLVVILLERYIL